VRKLIEKLYQRYDTMIFPYSDFRLFIDIDKEETISQLDSASVEHSFFHLLLQVDIRLLSKIVCSRDYSRFQLSARCTLFNFVLRMFL